MSKTKLRLLGAVVGCGWTAVTHAAPPAQAPASRPFVERVQYYYFYYGSPAYGA